MDDLTLFGVPEVDEALVAHEAVDSAAHAADAAEAAHAAGDECIGIGEKGGGRECLGRISQRVSLTALKLFFESLGNSTSLAAQAILDY